VIKTAIPAFAKRSTNALRRGDNRAPNFRVELRALEPAYGRRCLSAARWEVAMLSIIQANDLAVKLAVCAVFVFVGVVLLGAF
jgi:hypothetical protein